VRIYEGPPRAGDIVGQMTRTDGSIITNTSDYFMVVYQVVRLWLNLT